MLDVRLMEKTAFSLFSRESSDDFKRAVCYLVIKELDRAPGSVMSLSKLQQAIGTQFSLSTEDVRSAITVLKCPTAFKAVHVWIHKQNKDVTLVRSVNSPEISDWLFYLQSDYPHITKLVH